MIQHKKGVEWLGEETGKILLGVIVIVMLIGLIFVLFNLYAKNNKVLQAQTSLDKIAAAGLSLSQGRMKEVVYQSPRDWTMRFYEARKEGMNGCENGKCFCLCENKNCDIDSKYTCKVFSSSVNVISKDRRDYITFRITPSTLVVKNTGALEVSEK